MAKLGQHVMVDKRVLERIADSAQIRKGDRVLEIGAGDGILTEELVNRGAHVIAIEIDGRLFESLRARFPSQQLINADALRVRWPPFDKCVSNPPYSISKKLILKLLQHNFKLGVLTLQKEFAEKLAAKPGEKKYGVVSVCTQLCCDIELLGRIPRNAFRPQPKVDSRLVRLTTRLRLDTGFLSFVREMFQKRNKKVGARRVRELRPEDFLTLYQHNKTRSRPAHCQFPSL